jgi:hypothetical protein
MTHQRKVQLAWGLLAAALLVGAGIVQETRPTKGDMWEILPGRAFYVNYLWIRAERLKEEGKFYDAYQQAELICKLQRHFPGVWSFHSWNMTWNISVATHTPEERWRWVYNGAKLLRDQGIPYNPRSINLYKDLGWIFLFKIGGYLDDMHWVYKRQWAVRMQDLLGAPAQGTTRDVIDAFAPLADESLLDKDPARQGAGAVQADKLAELLKEPDVKAYAKELAAAGLDVNKQPQDMLAWYNLWSLSADVSAVCIEPPKPETTQDVVRYRLMNAPDYAQPRGRLLTFVRAQILWNVYRMDPAFMLELMKEYGPLDWRLPQPHGLYWVLLGRKICKEQNLDDSDVLNTQRNAFNCLKELTWRGRLTMIDARPRRDSRDAITLEPVRVESQMQLPNVRLYQLADLRYVEPLHQAYLKNIARQVKDSKTRFEANQFRDGHINYLAGAIKGLYASHRRGEAQKYYDYIRQNYKPPGATWQYRDVRDFYIRELHEDNQPIRDLAESLVGLSIVTGYVAQAVGDRTAAVESLQLARQAYDAYQQGRQERLRLLPLQTYSVRIAIELMLNPRSLGYKLPMTDRAELYRELDDETKKLIYPNVRQYLRQACKAADLDFDKIFPAPPGFKEQDAEPLPDDMPLDQ